MRKIINVPIKKLREYENNPRNNTLAVDKVKASIERVGFMFPVVIDMNYVIVAGHTRRLACEALKLKTVPCIMVDDLDPEQVDLFRYIDNKSSEYASWDYEKLAAELQKIDTNLEANKIVLNSFDFDLEAREFDIVPTAVPVATFNFMGEDYRKSEAVDVEKDEGEMEEDAEEYSGSIDDDIDVSVNTGVSGIGDGAMVFGGENAKAPVIHLFRCGSRRFIISEVEEERLNSAYLKYMGEEYPNSTFIQYLLGGREDVEIQPESAD